MIDHHLNRYVSRAICHPFQLLLLRFHSSNRLLSLVRSRALSSTRGRSIQNHVKLKRNTRPWLLKAIRDKKVSSLRNAFSLLTVGVTHEFNDFLNFLSAARWSAARSKQTSSNHAGSSASNDLIIKQAFLLYISVIFSPPDYFTATRRRLCSSRQLFTNFPLFLALNWFSSKYFHRRNFDFTFIHWSRVALMLLKYP